MNKETDFMLVNLSAKEAGVLKTVGERAIVVSIHLMDGADEADNAWLMEQARLLYQQYYSRVSEYKEV
jgi:hypothetical protein